MGSSTGGSGEMTERFSLMLEMQHQLQIRSMKDGDPMSLTGDDRALFLVWNNWALADEMHEAMAEIGWKPWAKSRHLNADAALKEMIDGFHFFMNILLVIAGEKGWTVERLAEEFTAAYMSKNAVNAQRQLDGYDGVSTKCGYCHRELTEVKQLGIVKWERHGLPTMSFCTEAHYHNLRESLNND